jgi:hypothetical protein
MKKKMNKNSYTPTFPFVALSFALLFSLFILAACGTRTGLSAQDVPAATNTASDATIEDKTTPDTGTSGTVTPKADQGFDCSSVNQIPSAECAALIALYNSTDGPNWVDNSGWLKTNALCTWSGISCIGDHISHINLLYNQLTGTLPPELGDLSHLRVLALWVNQLHGSIPPELGDLSELVSLEISSNQLTGSLPAELGNLGNLQSLGLSYNQLNGSIPAELGEMASLNSLSLSHNQLSGAIPAELGNLAKLTQLRLSHNQLSGSIPATLGNLSDLYDLDLSYNRLRGAVPESISLITQRTLWGNQLEGTIASSGHAPIAVDYKGIHFTADPSLATSIWPEVIPATPAQEDEPFWYAAPEHIRFTFADPGLPPGRFPMGINLVPEAQILIYPVAELVVIEPWGPARVETMQSLLAEKGPIPDGDLPLLPVANAAQLFHAQAHYLDFSNLQGLRFITQHTQENLAVINNLEMFYTFQGLTNDGAYYVAAFFPLTTDTLPDKVEVQNSEAFRTNFATYLSDTTTELDQLLPAEFTPDLTLLDAVISSLSVEPDGALFGDSTPPSDPF